MGDLLGIMEVISIIYILDLSWVNLLLECPKVVLVELSGILCGVSALHRMLHSLLILSIDSLSCGFGEALTIEVLARDLRDVPSVPWDVLRLHIAVRATDPVLTLHGLVTELELLSCFVLNRWIYLIVVLVIIWLGDDHINVLLGGLRQGAILGDDIVDLSSGAPEDLVLLGNMPSVTGKVILAVVDKGFSSHF